MIPYGDTWTAEYGRIGMPNFQTAIYPMSKWNSKYSEKIKKGYVDQTHLVAETISIIKKKSEYADIQDKFIADIVFRLQSMARKAISDNYTIKSSAVTQAMIDEAQVLLSELLIARSLDDFNHILLKLFKTIPRKMSKVADYLANSTSEFAKIISREQDLLDVMKGQVIQNQIEEDITEDETQTKDYTILDAMGLSFSRCSEKDILDIKRSLGDLSNKFVQAWKVTNFKTQKRFDEFVKNNNIKDTKLLFHGSRSENWWSILTVGLMLKPTNAVITGKMFGNGIYFSPKAKKSYGYCDGGYWVGGGSNYKFMALNDVAYGNPYVVYNFDSRFYSLDFNGLQNLQKGANCLHAKADKGMLRNDEIVVYKEEQVTVKYLVELK